MTFEAFHMEDHATCAYDYVEVSFGDYSERFCGGQVPGPFSSTDTITVKVHTDYSVTETGFSAVWTAAPASSSDTFTSRNHPDHYPDQYEKVISQKCDFNSNIPICRSGGRSQ